MGPGWVLGVVLVASVLALCATHAAALGLSWYSVVGTLSSPLLAATEYFWPKAPPTDSRDDFAKGMSSTLQLHAATSELAALRTRISDRVVRISHDPSVSSELKQAYADMVDVRIPEVEHALSDAQITTIQLLARTADTAKHFSFGDNWPEETKRLALLDVLKHIKADLTTVITGITEARTTTAAFRVALRSTQGLAYAETASMSTASWLYAWVTLKATDLHWTSAAIDALPHRVDHTLTGMRRIVTFVSNTQAAVDRAHMPGGTAEATLRAVRQIGRELETLFGVTHGTATP